MDKVSFAIYEPDGKKFHLTPDWIIYGSWFLCIGFLWLFDKYAPPNGTFRIILICIVFGSSICFLPISFFMYKPLNGTLTGKIIFDDDGITINDKTHKLTAINNLDFWFGDYYGKLSSNGRDFNPKLYQGVNNYVTFVDNMNQTNTIYFQMMGKHSSMALSSFINAAIKAKKMEFKHAIDLIGIENVSIN